MKHYNIFSKEAVNNITEKFKNKNGYIVKLLSGSEPNYVIGYIARCETPIKSDPDLITIYVQWCDQANFTIHDIKVLAMDRALKVAERYEKSLEKFEFKNELSTPTLEVAFPENPAFHIKDYFKNYIFRSYQDVKNFAQMCENKVNLFYKDKKKHIIWGNSTDFRATQGCYFDHNKNI